MTFSFPGFRNPGRLCGGLLIILRGSDACHSNGELDRARFLLGKREALSPPLDILSFPMGMILSLDTDH